MDGQKCDFCGGDMFVRRSKVSKDATQVCICPQCDAVVYIWPDGVKKWEQGSVPLPEKQPKSE